jgi:tRNA A-37 threonylcarbamoyl transferase component Bud32
MNVERVGKYRIIALLGQGGMASVFLSVVPGPMGVNKLLVVKLLREELSHDEEFLAMFLDEARLAARLNHANVVQTYEVGVEGRHHFLAMDYLDGQPLHAVLRRASGRDGVHPQAPGGSRVPLDVLVRILAETLAGLHYAHTLRDFDGTKLDVVHRDVSPQNVFVTYDGQVKVVDFGIAKAAGAASTTQNGVFKGKLAYVAPEQACGDHVDARADIFAVGVMLWEAIAGQRFAQADSQPAMLSRRLSGTEPRIRQVVPDVDAELAEICDRAMARRPSDRFTSAEEFRVALEGYLARTSPRLGAREVGQFVDGLFVQERIQIRLVIDEQMKRLQREVMEPLGDTRPTAGRNLDALDEGGAVTIKGERPVYDRYVWVTSEQPGSHEWSLFLATTLQVIEREETGISGHVSALVGVDGRANNPEYRQLCEIEARRSAAGLLLVNSAMLYLLPVLQAPGLPRVAIGATLPHASLVELDFAGLIERACARLLEKGQHVVVMSPHAPKLAAAQECLRARGLRAERLLTMHAAPIGCERLTELMFDRQNRPDAIFVADDNLVAPVLAGLQRAGVRAGKDVYVLAHCNWPRPLGMGEGVEHLGFDVREVLCAGKDLIDAHRDGARPPTRLVPSRFLEELTRPLQTPRASTHSGP